MKIKRTQRAYEPKAAAWVQDCWGEVHGYADQVEVGEYPTHSSVLGPDSRPLEYEPRQPFGFATRGKSNA